MFIGYQLKKIGEELKTVEGEDGVLTSVVVDITEPFISYIAETKEELENMPCVTFDKIEETDEPVELVNGRYCVGETAINKEKSEEARSIRNQYLETYVDPVVSNPLRWGDMTAEEQQEYADYRRYLLDITECAEFPNVEVMTMDEWKQSLEEISQEPSETAENEEENPVEEIGDDW